MFEIFFKYPVSLFQKGHFVFLTPWPLWLMAVGIVVAAGMLFWHIHRNHGMLSGARPIAIWLLETAMAALLLFLLWHPALSVATLKPQQNVIAVLVDNSRTMAIADSSGTREAAAGALVKSLLPSMPGRTVVQWDKEDCADLGIIKVDLLGLGMMAVLKDCLELIPQHYGEKIDLAQLPEDQEGDQTLQR